jgi:hypothetical protein
MEKLKNKIEYSNSQFSNSHFQITSNEMENKTHTTNQIIRKQIGGIIK